MSGEGAEGEDGGRRRPKQIVAESREVLRASARELEAADLRVPTAAECLRDLRGNLLSASSHGHVHHPRNLGRVRSLATRTHAQVPPLGGEPLALLVAVSPTRGSGAVSRLGTR